MLTEPGWTLDELAKAIQKLNLDKAADEYGLATGLFKHLLDVYLPKLLEFLCWTCLVMCLAMVRCHTMLGKHFKAKLVSELRPIANVRVLYNTFAHMFFWDANHHKLNTPPPQNCKLQFPLCQNTGFRAF